MEANHFNDYIGKKTVALNILVTGLFFGFFTYILIPYVPAQTTFWQVAVAAFTAACLSGPFFIALNMFELVLGESRSKR